MKNVKGSISTLVCVMLSLVLILSACSSSKTVNTSATPAIAVPEKELPPVELIWYYPQPKGQADLKAVNDEINKIIQAKINATVKLMPVDFGSYEQKLNTVVAANEAIDIIWSSSWLFGYVQNQDKGAFQPLDDLLNKEGKVLFDSIDTKFWEDMKIGGKIYGVPNYQISAKNPGLYVQKRFIDKYNFDVSTVKKIEDIEPLLQKIKDGDAKDGIVPFGVVQGFFDEPYYNIDGTPYANVYMNDSTNKVLNRAFMPEFKQYLTMVHSWYTKGFINKDAATITGQVATDPKGERAVIYDVTGKPGGEIDIQGQNGGNPVVFIPLAKPYFTGASSTLNTISHTSKNPERAMMFLQLVNTDKALFNLITYGIEGKHYTKVDDKFIKLTPDSTYNPTTDWVFGNTTNGYLPEGAPADKFELTKKVNDAAAVSPYYGFVFDPEPVKTELANTKAVDDEYGPGLGSGTVDPDKYLPILQDKLKKAGVDKIIAEQQKQLDEWLKTRAK
ncbi:DUF3502 domain-containing protein [Paenibacillus psychroresistens]|uniref:DUF3502 domain-containing protein n=1 Tax=Paenibacillus psychroresistens TaxID=1778678 RepID=A0A6B8RE60_9BACL|nr:ABC transporter substrate-binding protein [Paenibacillus psychroresistens]QGQ94440.1 DUF3502 domain-containing protein [Paenibacillus psychroresistens]